MAVIIRVKKQGNEYAPAVLRRFSQKVRGAGIIQHVRNIRYRTRPLSKTMKKRSALIRLQRKERYEKMVKEGKITPTPQAARR